MCETLKQMLKLYETFFILHTFQIHNKAKEQLWDIFHRIYYILVVLQFKLGTMSIDSNKFIESKNNVLIQSLLYYY